MIKVGVVQMLVGRDKQSNVKSAVAKIREAAQAGARLVVLPVRAARSRVIAHPLQARRAADRSASIRPMGRNTLASTPRRSPTGPPRRR